MTALRRNGFSRDISCQWTESQADPLADVFEGTHHEASAVLVCSDRGAEPAATSVANSVPTIPPSIIPRTTTRYSARPSTSIPPLVTSKSLQSTPSSTLSQPIPASETTATTSTSIITPSNQPSTTSIPQTSSTASSSQTTTLFIPVQSPPTQSPPTQSLQTTLSTSTSQSASPNVTQPSTSISASASSSLLLSATVPFVPLSTSTLVPTPSSSSSPNGTSSGSAGSERGTSPTSKPSSGGITSQAGIVIGVVITVVILLAVLLTTCFFRRNNRKKQRQSLGQMSTAREYKPWKKKEVERPNTIPNVQGVLDLDQGQEQTYDTETGASPMGDRTVQFPALGIEYDYEGRGSSSWPLEMPEPAFARRRASHSSSHYSETLYDRPPNSNEQFAPKETFALSSPTRAGYDEDDQDSFVTLPEPLRVRKMQERDVDLPLNSSTLPRSEIYIARPYSVFDIAYDDMKYRGRDRDRESEISGFSGRDPIDSWPRSRFSNSSSNSASEAEYMTSLPNSRYNRNSSRSYSSFRSRFSQASDYTTSTITNLQREMLTVRDLDADTRLSLDVDEEYGFRKSEFGIPGLNFNAERSNIEDNESENGFGFGSASGGPGGGDGLEEWEEREIERRRIEVENARLYNRQLRAGVGVQKFGGGGELGVQTVGGDGELGVQRSLSSWELGVQRASTMYSVLFGDNAAETRRQQVGGSSREMRSNYI